LFPERNLTGNWQGTSVTLTRNLKVSPPVPAQLEWPVEGNQRFFLPDGISLSCPSKVNVGSNFTIAANWLVTPSYLQQVTSGMTIPELFRRWRLKNSTGLTRLYKSRQPHPTTDKKILSLS
jgi:hypothetical protein